MADLAAALDAHERALAAWWERVEAIHPRLQDIAAEEWSAVIKVAMERAGDDPRESAYETLDDMAASYLQAEPSARRSVRDELDRRPHVLHTLYAYIGRCAAKLREDGTDRWLYHGLAAASIEDGRWDFRDLYAVLWDLYVAAKAAGRDPGLAFREVGELSSGAGRARGMLIGFEESAYFADMRRRQELH